MSQSTVTLHGIRGSCPVSGESVRRYGGSTPCVSLETPEGLLVVDAGTGIVALGETLIRRPKLPPITILFTHFHLDHVVGLPAFKPLLRRDAHITLMADSRQAPKWREALNTIVGRPFWPFQLSEASAEIVLEDLPLSSGPSISGPINRHGVQISWCSARHPQGGLSYRFALPDQTVVLATDREHGNAQMDAAFRQLSEGADVMIHDAQYTPEEYPRRLGWGHSTWQQAVEAADAAGVRELILTSHDPMRSDDEVDEIVRLAQARFPNTIAAAEGMVLPTPAKQAGLEASGRSLRASEEGTEPDKHHFKYRFRFKNREEKAIDVNLRADTLELIQPPRDISSAPWTALSHHQCKNCPLKPSEEAQCPAATALIEPLEIFGGAISTEAVDVVIETDARHYVKKALLPEAVSALLGVLMVTSGCPVMGKLRPMVRHHIPFATLEETQFRVLSMYLLSQYFVSKQGGRADWKMRGLSNLYEEVRTVNADFFKRLADMNIEDAALNAIVRLDAFADAITFMLDQAQMDQLAELFHAYLNDPGEMPESGG